MDTAVPYFRRRGGFAIQTIDTRRRVPPNGKHFSQHAIIICRTVCEAWIDYLEQYPPAKIIYVIDDFFAGAAQSEHLSDQYRQKMANIQLSSQRLLALADHLVVSSQFLYDYYQGWQPLLLQPALSSKYFASPSPVSKSMRLAYHGTSSHAHDFAHIKLPLINMLNNKNVRLTSFLGRFTPKEIEEHASTLVLRPMKWPIYKFARRFMRADIGLSPLLGTDFNCGKSGVKFLDITALGGVGIYSKRAPYTDIVEHGVNGLLAEDDLADWEACLLQLIDDDAGRLVMAKNARALAFSKAHPKWHYRFWLKLLA